MPDLFAHFASGYLVSRQGRLHKHATFLVLGAVLPDILTRIPEIVLDRYFGLPIFHFVAIFHTPFCLLLTSFALSLLFEKTIRVSAFSVILLGSYLHIILDLMQKQFGRGVYMPLFPFTFEPVKWSIFHINASIALFPLFLGLVLIAWLFKRRP